MMSIFVTIKIKEGFSDQFREASFGDSEGSVRDEPGCFRFDILQNSECRQVFHLYEVYEDDQAFEAHKKTPHFKKWFSAVEPWLDGEIKSVKMSTVFPSDIGWKNQKSSLTQW
ncbi:MAG: putative quinol monooxygenase [Alphaproteobacteria bacterium]|jgi:quinol monooxygenase YgiN|nr:antibiotic biosynthesis monooxygenase [Alphaproteobacteria bacterium]